MKHLVKLLVVLACVVAWSTGAVAEDRWPPPWDLSLPNQTLQTWDFAKYWTELPPIGTTMEPGWEVLPLGPVENPYGQPTLTFLDPVTIQEVDGPDGESIVTVHIDGDGTGGGYGKVSIFIPNFPEPNAVKKVFWQMTADKSATPKGDPPTTNPPGTNVPTNYPQIGLGGTWYTYNGMIEIRPNPEGEWLTFELAASTNIDQIVVKTVCTNVPEPSTFVLIGCGLVSLLVVIRRRR
ncbi:MAG: PEP-CTERM sorting domain-containing protein [Pirellulales bacterium]|nr:PEP-CTERM sorting domain-containing protein [Pirellulales bacterium]